GAVAPEATDPRRATRPGRGRRQRAVRRRASRGHGGSRTPCHVLPGPRVLVALAQKWELVGTGPVPRGIQPADGTSHREHVPVVTLRVHAASGPRRVCGEKATASR